MNTFSTAGITASVILDTRREKSNCMYPVKFRVTYLRKQIYYPSGSDLSEQEWQDMNGDKKRNKSLKEKEELIQEGFEQVKDHIKYLVKGPGFSLEALSKRLSRGTKDDFLNAFTVKVTELNKNDQVGSAEYYDSTLKNIKLFTDKALKFSDITPDWLKRYERHLIKAKKSYTTVGMRMRAIRHIMNEGLKNGIINTIQYPFGKADNGKYEIPQGTGRKKALTLNEISKVMNQELDSETERMCRDLWEFSFLCNGANLADIVNLKFKNISDSEIHFYRKKTIRTSKTKKEITVPMLDRMDDIINRWGNADKKPENYIFPFLKGGESATDEKRIVKNVTSLVNKKMKILGEELGFGRISTYAARHSYATILKNSGASVAYIAEALGHKNVTTTENYLKSFEKEQRLENQKRLTGYLKLVK